MDVMPLPQERVDPHHPYQVVHGGYTVLVTRPDGTFDGTGREGLYDFDTRILSRYRIALDGKTPKCVGACVIDGDTWLSHLTVPREGGTSTGPVLPQDVFEIRIDRRIGPGMEEHLRVGNHSMAEAQVELAIELDADFADVLEIDGPRQQMGTTTVHCDAAGGELRFDYHVEQNGHALDRGLRVRVADASSRPECEGRAIRFWLELAPRASWAATLSYASLVDGRWRERIGDQGAEAKRRTALRERWRRERATLESSNALVSGVFERAAEDLLALRDWEGEEAPDAWLPHAGVPTYTGLFGRDTLTAAWQGALLGPEMMRGTFARLAATQAAEDSAWRDEEPGKLLHEMRRGPLSELDLVPQRAYYGEQTAPSMFVVVLSEYWHWTGDAETLARYRDTALRTFEWAERYGDRDGDGLLEYARRSPKGLKNHAWKDSDEAIRYPDGTLVENPIATIEEQAYHYIALQRMAEVLLALGDDADAEQFLGRARALRRRVNEAFWMEDEQFYAIGLDPKKRPVRSIASNPGHALAAGLVPPDRARAVADRLLAPDMFSGWGIRTLSADHPSYNPFAYHLGTVWPVENATFALGFKRHGLDEHVERIGSALLGAAARFANLRLPEALGGHQRDASQMPAFYPGSNAPQAWSASAVIQLMQVMLGIYPFAPARLLALVRPRLPAWLPTVTLRRVRVGDAVVSIRFTRRDDGSAVHDVIDQAGSLHVITAPPPADLAVERESVLDRVKEWALQHAPGHLARVLRVALGVEV